MHALSTTRCKQHCTAPFAFHTFPADFAQIDPGHTRTLSQGTSKHFPLSAHSQRGEWILIVDVITSDRGSRAVQAAWHTHPNATVTVDAATGFATIRGVGLKTEQPSDVRLALIPATGAAAQSWSGSKVVKGQLAGKDGATEDQGWYSEHYSDATAGTKTHLLCHFYAKNDQFTKTGSGRTYRENSKSDALCYSLNARLRCHTRR